MKFNQSILTLVILAAGSCSIHAAEDIRVGVTAAFTGGSSSLGVSMRNGVELAIKEINAAGGVNGHKIVPIERDDEAKNERGVQIAQELINNQKIVAVFGFVNTGVGVASQGFYQDAKIPVFNNGATGTILTHQYENQPANYIFSNSVTDAVQAPMIIEEAVVKRGLTKVAILADSTNYGQLGRQSLEIALKNKGITAVAVEKFNVKDVDMTPQLLKAKEAGAEVILTYAIGPEVAQIANGMAKLAWKKPIIGSFPISMAGFIDNAGKNGDGATMPQTFIQVGNTPKRKAFIEAYLKEFKPKNDRIESPSSAAQGYDSIYLFAAAVKQANSTEGPKILTALENLNTNVDGVVATFHKPFSKNNHDAITPKIAVMGMVENGRVQYEYKEDAERSARNSSIKK